MWLRPLFVACLVFSLCGQKAVEASAYVPLTFSAIFQSPSAFCAFAESQYARDRKPIGIVSFSNISSLPACSGVVAPWVPVDPATTTAISTTTAATSTTAAPTVMNTTSFEPTTPSSNETVAPSSTSLEETTSSTAPSTTTAPPQSSTDSPSAAFRVFQALNGTEASTTEMQSTTGGGAESTTSSPTTMVGTTEAPSNTTEAPSSTSNGTGDNSTTTAPTNQTTDTPAPPVYGLQVSFIMADSDPVDTITRENWILSLSEDVLLALFDIRNVTYSQGPSPSAPQQIPTDDPRANTTALPGTADVIFYLQLTSYYRYRLPAGDLLPWLLNNPSAGSIWASLGVILLGLTSSNADIDVAARWFPMSWTSPQGSVSDVSNFNEDEVYSQAMFPCTKTYVNTPDTADRGDGYSCWFRLAGDATVEGSTITPAAVMALLNSEDIRAEVAASLGGGIALSMVAMENFPRTAKSFAAYSTAAQDDYSAQKSYFAAGLVVWFVLTVGALMALWVWTGSGRTMS